MADFYEDNELTMKQFLVVLAMGYVLDAIPDLMEVGSSSIASSQRLEQEFWEGCSVKGTDVK